MSDLVHHEELMKLADARQNKTLVDWLNSKGIVYLISRKGRITTTIQAINRAMISDPDERIEFGGHGQK